MASLYSLDEERSSSVTVRVELIGARGALLLARLLCFSGHTALGGRMVGGVGRILVPHI